MIPGNVDKGEIVGGECSYDPRGLGGGLLIRVVFIGRFVQAIVLSW
jgi:hypothetical protein